MSNCFSCPYKYAVQRKFGETYHCNLEPTNMDVSYFCRDKHKDEQNTLCPFIDKNTRFPGVDYTKYETDDLTLVD